VEADTERFGALIGKGADVYIFLKATLCHQFDCYLAEFIYSIGEVNIYHPAAIKHSLIVLFNAKEVKLFLFTIPVAPDAFKDGEAVVKEVGHGANFGFLKRDKLLMEIGV